MGIRLEYSIAKKYLKSKRKESFISFISGFALVGITLGVAVLIIVMSVMNGFRKEIINNFIGSGGHIIVHGQEPKILNYDELILNIKKTNLVINAFPSISEQGLVSYKNNSNGVMVESLLYEDLISREVLAKGLKGVNLEEFKNNKNVILLGRVIARNLGVKQGDNITLVSPNGYSTFVGNLPRFASFKVAGIINSGMYQYDSSVVVLPFKVGQEFFFYDKATQKVEVFLANPNDVNSIAEKLYAITQRDYNMETWEDSNKYLINALDVERNVMFLILSLVILIAAFNIISGLFMLVRSKTKEVAILRTIGLTKASIVRIFLLMGIRIGFLGTFFGSLIGMLFSYNIESIRKFLEFLIGANLFAEEIYFLSKLPADVKSFQVFTIIAMALVFSIIASVYPAIKAATITPVKGLKYE